MGSKDSPRQTGWLEGLALRLGPGKILALLAGVFLLDLMVPDPLPFVDEIVLGLLTALAAIWKGRDLARDPRKPPPKNVTPP